MILPPTGLHSRHPQLKPIRQPPHPHRQHLTLFLQDLQSRQIILHTPARLHNLAYYLAVLCDSLGLLAAELLEDGAQVGVLGGELADVVLELDLQGLFLEEEGFDGVVDVYGVVFRHGEVGYMGYYYRARGYGWMNKIVYRYSLGWQAGQRWHRWQLDIRQALVQTAQQGPRRRHQARRNATLRQRHLRRHTGPLTKLIPHRRRIVQHQLRHPTRTVRLVLSQQPLSKTPMFLPSLGIFLDRVLHPNLPTRKVLPIHLRYGQIRGVKIIIANKPITLTDAILRITVDLRTDNHAKIAKSVIQHLLVHFRVQVADEQVRTDILHSFILRSFVNFDGFAE